MRLPLFTTIFLLLLMVWGCQDKRALYTPPPAEPLPSHVLTSATQDWPILPPQAYPNSLRPCCSFGFDLQAKVLGIPVPFYSLNNIVSTDALGQHHYNNRMFNSLRHLMGFDDEVLGLIYTNRGGFIDIAHVRDTADNTLFLFSQLLPTLGEGGEILLSQELAERKIVLTEFTPPERYRDRYTLAAYMAANLGYQLAVWHEIAQWYGYQSVPGFSEEVSAFSPEDLYSNLLGARLALEIILSGKVASLKQYNESMTEALPIALAILEAESVEVTQRHFQQLDGLWWNSKERLPEKFLVLYRDYSTGSDRWPNMPSGSNENTLRLSLPTDYRGYQISELIELQLWSTGRGKLPPPPESHYWTEKDFNPLGIYADQADLETLAKRKP